MKFLKSLLLKFISLLLSFTLSLTGIPSVDAGSYCLSTSGAVEADLLGDLNTASDQIRVKAGAEYRRAVEMANADPENAPAIMATAIVAYNRAMHDSRQAADKALAERIFGKEITRRTFLGGAVKVAAALGLGSMLSLEKLLARELKKIVDEEAFVMSNQQMSKVTKFLINNKDKEGMPLSYQVPDGYWKSIKHRERDVDQTIERLLTTNGLNLYDGACWQIATRLMGYNYAEEQTKRLLKGGKTGFMDFRAQQRDFDFNGKKFGGFRNNKGWFFRVIASQWEQKDPMTGNRNSFPGFPDPDQRLLHHTDWRPIAGENAWATYIGPLQDAFKKYNGLVPLDCDEVELALSTLECTEAMQSGRGVVYYAPWGTDRVYSTTFSLENNISMFAGLMMLLEVLERYQDQRKVNEHIATIRKILFGEGAEHDGILGFFQCKEVKDFVKEHGVLPQGGILDGATNTMRAKIKFSEAFAVDVQTWGILVFTPELIDEWYEVTDENGNTIPASYGIWQHTKTRGGYRDRNNVLRGVGFSDGNDVFSGEWTGGAIMMLRSMAEHYKKTSETAAYAREAGQDSITMRNGIENELKVNMKDGSVAYKYANRRYQIDFGEGQGWWANPIPSLASSDWALMVDLKYNPLEFGGNFRSLKKRIPQSFVKSKDAEQAVENVVIIEGSDFYDHIVKKKGPLERLEPPAYWHGRGGNSEVTKDGIFICKGNPGGWTGVDLERGPFSDLTPYKEMRFGFEPLTQGANQVTLKIELTGGRTVAAYFFREGDTMRINVDNPTGDIKVPSPHQGNEAVIDISTIENDIEKFSVIFGPGGGNTQNARAKFSFKFVQDPEKVQEKQPKAEELQPVVLATNYNTPWTDGENYNCYKRGKFDLSDARYVRVHFNTALAGIKIHTRLLPSGIDPNDAVGVHLKGVVIPKDGVVTIPINEFNLTTEQLKDIVELGVISGSRMWQSDIIGADGKQQSSSKQARFDKIEKLVPSISVSQSEETAKSDVTFYARGEYGRTSDDWRGWYAVNRKSLGGFEYESLPLVTNIEDYEYVEVEVDPYYPESFNFKIFITLEGFEGSNYYTSSRFTVPADVAKAKKPYTVRIPVSEILAGKNIESGKQSKITQFDVQDGKQQNNKDNKAKFSTAPKITFKKGRISSRVIPPARQARRFPRRALLASILSF